MNNAFSNNNTGILSNNGVISNTGVLSNIQNNKDSQAMSNPMSNIPSFLGSEGQSAFSNVNSQAAASMFMKSPTKKPEESLFGTPVTTQEPKK